MIDILMAVAIAVMSIGSIVVLIRDRNKKDFERSHSHVR